MLLKVLWRQLGFNASYERDGKNGSRIPRTQCGVKVDPAENQDQGLWVFTVTTVTNGRHHVIRKQTKVTLE